MPADLLLLPSPLLPVMAYATFADALRQAGLDCRIADATDARSAAQLIDRWAADASPATRLIAHSNAGYLAPGVRAKVASSEPIVFMDAAFPPATGTTPLAPAGLRARLAELVDETTRLLPPWTQWWPRESMLQLVPESMLESLEVACPRLPLSYFDSEVEAPPGWADTPHRYLAFGETYAEEVAFARDHGWSVVQLAGRHLEFLNEPTRVAEVVASLLHD